MAVDRIRFIPRGVAGWTLLILINVLLLMSFGQFVVIRLIAQEVSSFTERDTIADRVYVLDRVFRATPDAHWESMVASLDQPNFRVMLSKPDPLLLDERARERPLINIAADMNDAWKNYMEAEAARKKNEMVRAEEFDRAAYNRAMIAIEQLRPLADGNDPVVAEVARNLIDEIDFYFKEGEFQRILKKGADVAMSAISWIRPRTPNTAVFVPVRSADMQPEIYVTMELYAQRLNMASTRDKSRRPIAAAALAQRVSPFLRAWYGPRFEERPYLERSPDNPETLRVILPVSMDKWVIIDAGTAEHAVADFTPYLQAFLVVGVLILVVTGWATTRLTAPIARFAEATERLGRDVNATPVELTGPADVRKAAAAFNRMQQRIQAYVRDRTTMLAAISHDLRTPLTRLRLRGEFMDEAQQEKYFRDLDEMEAMITAALDFARDESKSEESGLIDIASLCRALALDMQDAGKTVTCLYQGPPLAVEVRPMAFRRALMNILENAVAYGQVARMDLSESPAGITLTIDDDGPGIPPDQMEQVFAPFYRLETSRNRKTGGVGLGLATVRSIVRSHGGDVTLTNRPEGGLRVGIFLPR